MSIKILIGLLNLMVLVATIAGIHSKTKRNSFIGGLGAGVLRLPVILAVTGYFTLLLSAIFIVLPIYFIHFSLVNQIISNSIFLFLCLAAFLLITYQFNHRVFFTEYYFEVQSLQGEVVSNSWDEVASIRHYPLLGKLVITNNEDYKIVVSTRLNGYKQFLNFLKEKCPKLK